MQNYYDILKLAPDSGDADISDRVGERRTQLLRLIKIPKRREDAQQELQQLEVIARTLLDPRERAAYDARLVEPAPPAEPIATAPIDIPAPPPTKFCAACGNAIGEGNFFCNQCGRMVHAPPEVLTAAISTRTEPGNVTEELPGSAAEPQIPTPRDSRNQDTVRSVQPLPLPALPIGATQSRGRLIAQVVVLLLVVAAVVYFWPHSPPPVAVQPPPMPGMVKDIRPATVSLLNPPVMRPAPAAAWDSQNIHGTVVIKSNGDSSLIVYPAGEQFILPGSFYSPSGRPSAAFDSNTGTVRVSSGFPLMQNNYTPWNIQISTDQLRDINGDGWPELIFSDYSGGAHCCTSVLIVSLRPKGPAVIFDEALGSTDVTISDLDGDGRREITRTVLSEYALGSFATGSYGLKVIYSAASDGAYRPNTRAFPSILTNDLNTAAANYQKANYGAPEEEDVARIELFFLSYLSGPRAEAYEYLRQLKPIEGLKAGSVLATLEGFLKAAAPEVLRDPEWQQIVSGTMAPLQQPTQGEPQPQLAVQTPGAVTKKLQEPVPVAVAPLIDNFEAVPLPADNCNVVLRWNVSGAAVLTIEPNVGIVKDPSGYVVIRPSMSTRYTIKADGPGGSVTKDVTVQPVPASCESHFGNARQDVTSSSVVDHPSTSSSRPSGVLLFASRTTAHVTYHKLEEFTGIVDNLISFLKSNGVPVVNDLVNRSVVSEQTTSTDTLVTYLRQIGAQRLLVLTVDASFTVRLKLILRCYDPEGKLLWEESVNAKNTFRQRTAVAQATEELHKRLDYRIQDLRNNEHHNSTPPTVTPPVAVAPDATARRQFAETVRDKVIKKMGRTLPSGFNITADGPDANIYVSHLGGTTYSGCSSMLANKTFVSRLRNLGYIQLVCTDDGNIRFTFNLAHEQPVPNQE